MSIQPQICMEVSIGVNIQVVSYYVLKAFENDFLYMF